MGRPAEDHIDASKQSRWRLLQLFALAALTAISVASAAQAAAPPRLVQFCKTGDLGGQCRNPRGLAVNQDTGHIYAVTSNRINEFTAWGEFVRAWGGGVVSGGASGTGGVSIGSTKVTSVVTTSKEFVPGMLVEGAGIPAGTRVVGTGGDFLVLSAAATATGPTALTSPEDPDNVPVNERQRIEVTATGGTYKLRLDTFLPEDSQTTADITYNATPAQVQSALEVLANVGAGNVVVTSVNPGGTAGVPGGPYLVEFTGTRFADTDVDELKIVAGASPLSEGSVTPRTIRTGAGAAEVCSGENCREAVSSQGIESGPGQFDGLKALAIDSQGALYTYESSTAYNTFNCPGPDCEQRFFGNNRVQKFGAGGEFELMYGADVGQGPKHPGDLCTAVYISEGDTCGSGLRGGGDGEFGVGSFFGLDARGSFIAAGPGDRLYVGGQERIQVFDPDGTHLKTLPLEGSAFALAVDNAPASPSYGSLYVSLSSDSLSGPVVKADVLKIDPATGAVLGKVTVPYPEALATDPAGNLYVYQPYNSGVDVGSTAAKSELMKFGPTGKEIYRLVEDEMIASRGIAASLACGVDEASLLAANTVESDPDGRNTGFFINIYGKSPSPELCPPPEKPPTILAQFATGADSTGASLRAAINPHFWNDTRYFVEFGTGKCSEGGCDRRMPAAPGSLLTDSVVDGEVDTPEVYLQGLDPDTDYHYRFVAESGGGGPVRGVGGTVGVDGKEAVFHTRSSSSESNVECPNQRFRTGPSAQLPDCRAYELVSPLDKNNGDVARGEASLAQAAVGGDRLSFNSFRSFGDSEGAPLSSQYLAERREGSGWVTEAISQVRDSVSLYPIGGTTSFQYKGFSEDLCSGWLVQDTDVALAPGAPAGVPNLYRRRNCEDDSYELLTSTTPPGFEAVFVESRYYPYPQGASADGSRTFFRANAALAVEGGGPRAPFRCPISTEADSLVYRWLRNGEPIAGATTAAYTAGTEDEGKVIQCQVHAADPEGGSVGTSRALVITPVPAQVPPLPPRESREGDTPIAGEIDGAPFVGETLTCVPGSWKGSPDFSYRWLANGQEIAGATGSEYILAAVDRGTAIQCEIVATNAGGTAVADTVPLLVQSRPPVASAAPTVTGIAAAGETLTCAPGSWSGSPAFAYQWLRNGANIGSATSPTYLVAAGDAGKAIQCRVTGTNADGAAGAISAASVVAPPPATPAPEPSVAPTASGTAAVGETLTCSSGTWVGEPGLSYRWFRNGSPISPPKTASTYTLEAADRSKSIQCQVVAANSGGSVAAITPPRYVDPAPPDATPRAASHYQVYVSYGGGKLRLVSVLPDGTPSHSSASVGTGQFFEAGFRGDSVYRAVSEDGDRVFWSAADNPGVPPNGTEGDRPGPLYLRVNATAPQSEVVGGECTEPEKACTIAVSMDPTTHFVMASSDGSRVLYRVGPASGGTLYEAEIAEAGGHLVALTQQIAGDLGGVMGAGDDLARVYFASGSVLSGSQQNSNGEIARPGEPNLYMYERGGGITYIGTVRPSESPSTFTSATRSPFASQPFARTSRVAADGQTAVFVSSAPLTGYDNIDRISGQPAAEVYRFDAAKGDLLCISCNPSGVRPKAREEEYNSTLSFFYAATLPGWTTQTHPGNALSADGSRVFFDAYDALVPGDTNGRKDVYEWEAPGSGSCQEGDPQFSEPNGGCIYLISSGESPEDSEFFDATPSGSDVFFVTQSSLVVQDFGLVDVYDARIDGGFPAPAPPPPACEGEACQGPISPPNDPTPASAQYQGAGNVREGKPKPRPCAKGKVRRKGRCVKKPKRPGKKRTNDHRRNGR